MKISNAKRFKAIQKQKGFTLVEIAIVLAILAMLIYFAIPGLLQNKEDAKYSTALSLLGKDFPSAITKQVARTNVCSTSSITKSLLEDRGLPALTVWNTAWTVSAVTSNTVTVNYTIDSADTKVASDLATALSSSNNVVSATASGTGSINVAYRCN